MYFIVFISYVFHGFYFLCISWFFISYVFDCFYDFFWWNLILINFKILKIMALNGPKDRLNTVLVHFKKNSNFHSTCVLYTNIYLCKIWILVKFCADVQVQNVMWPRNQRFYFHHTRTCRHFSWKWPIWPRYWYLHAGHWHCLSILSLFFSYLWVQPSLIKCVHAIKKISRYKGNCLWMTKSDGWLWLTWTGFIPQVDQIKTT